MLARGDELQERRMMSLECSRNVTSTAFLRAIAVPPTLKINGSEALTATLEMFITTIEKAPNQHLPGTPLVPQDRLHLGTRPTGIRLHPAPSSHPR